MPERNLAASPSAFLYNFVIRRWYYGPVAIRTGPSPPRRWPEPFNGRLHVTGDPATGDSPAHGPLCPHCRASLRDNLRQDHLVPQGGVAMAVTYCGACGWTLDCAPARAAGPAGFGLMRLEEVAAPADEQTLEGQFQVRCRELIGEIRSLGFNPNVWVAMINDLGAAGAARKLLADHHELVVTPWLVRRGQAGAHPGAHDRTAEMGRAIHRGRTRRGSAAARAGREEPAQPEGLAQASRAIIRQAPMTNQLTFNEAREPRRRSRRCAGRRCRRRPGPAGMPYPFPLA